MSKTPNSATGRNPKFASIGLVEIGEELAHARRAGHQSSRGLVGRFFHSECTRGWQGQVVDECQPGVYVVQLFSWWDGGASNQHLMRLEEMMAWQFYDTAEDMIYAYEHGGLAERWRQERDSSSGSEAC